MLKKAMINLRKIPIGKSKFWDKKQKGRSH